MAPLNLDQEALQTLLKDKICNALKKDGILDEVEDVLMEEPEHLKGEHMATASWYVEVKFKNTSLKPRHLFMKKYFNIPAQTAMAKEMKIMDKESSFYLEFLPAARKFCKRHTGSDDLLHFFPKCLFGDDEIVLMDNVVLNDGFEMLPKLEMQDLKTAKYVLRNLAKFHAVSYAMAQDSGIEQFREQWALNILEVFISGEKNPFVCNLFDNGVNTCVKILKSNSINGGEETIKKLSKLLGKTYDEAERCIFLQPDEPLYALNHGDCWNNNMLFKLDPNSREIVDHIFIDLQITRLGSPNLDVGYFLHTSVKPPVRRAHLEELLQEYFETFQSTCNLLNTNCPVTFKEFFNDYKNKSTLGFYFSLMTMTAIGALKDIDLESIADNPDPKALDELFNSSVDNWVDRNPDKAAEIAVEIVAAVKEYETLTGIQLS